jgi:hypothetical protein
MEESTSPIFRFFMSGVAGCAPTVRPQIAAQLSLVERGQISWCEYANRVAGLVTDRSVYTQLIGFYQLQAVGWGMTILASSLYS